MKVAEKSKENFIVLDADDLGQKIIEVCGKFMEKFLEQESMKKVLYDFTFMPKDIIDPQPIPKKFEVPEYVPGKKYEIPEYVPGKKFPLHEYVEGKTYEIPQYKAKTYEIPEYVPKTYEVPGEIKFVDQEALTDTMRGVLTKCLTEAMRGALKDAVKVEVIPVKHTYDIDVPNIKERDVFSDKVKVHDLHVDVARLHYKCQKCGHEVE